MQEVLDEFDMIECFEQPGRQLRLGEITQRQIGFSKDRDIDPPGLVIMRSRMQVVTATAKEI